MVPETPKLRHPESLKLEALDQLIRAGRHHRPDHGPKAQGSRLTRWGVQGVQGRCGVEEVSGLGFRESALQKEPRASDEDDSDIIGTLRDDTIRVYRV